MNRIPLSEDLPRRLAESLLRPLPGPQAQKSFEPQLSYGRHQGPAPADARRAAVLLLLYRHRGQWRLPLTRRPGTLPEHAGQICLPGGQIDAGETPEETALRESREELGVGSGAIKLLGRLSPIYVFASNYSVTPCVAATGTRPAFQPNPAEVAELLEPGLADLLDPENYDAHQICHPGVRFRAPHIQYHGHRIWGATSVILAEFLAVLQ